MDMNGDKSTSHEQPTSQPTTCKSSTCTFFGSSSSEGYCSVCYKDILKKKNGPPPGASQVTPVVQAKSSNSASNTLQKESSSSTTIPKESSENPTSKSNKSQAEKEIRPKTPENITEAFKNQQQSTSSTTPVPAPEIATPSSTKSTPSKPKKRKCQMCKKKIGLTGFECRCGKLFCAIHRYADVHDCTFDYKEDGREKIRKANPTCTDDKITRF